MCPTAVAHIQDLPTGASPAPITFAHFPSRLHAVIWRNWDVVDINRLARVLDAEEESVLRVGRSMGLWDPPALADADRERLYMTVIRRNWHLLDYRQICELVGWDATQMATALQEDDFLWIKLGSAKPRAQHLRFHEPSPDEVAAAAAIAGVVQRERMVGGSREPLFGFTEKYGMQKPRTRNFDGAGVDVRMVYPYMLPYGDPLVGDAVDLVTDGYLAELASSGVNAIWLQVVLGQIAPWPLEPSLSAGWEQRIAHLNRLVDRCATHGVKVFVYLNEPRGLPPEFFERHPELRGVAETPTRAKYSPEVYALCTSTREGKAFLVNSVEHLFSRVPSLGGVLTITYSENLTNCYSREYDFDDECPRCRDRGPAEVNAEINSLIDEGMRRAGSTGRLILYVWSTPDEWIPGIIDALPDSTYVQCISEWGKPFKRGSYEGKVNEYSISVVGPSDESRAHWKQARGRGLATAAKMQVVNSFELYTLPYIPALRLVAQHVRNVLDEGIDAMMLAWTAGGAPSPNLDIVGELLANPALTIDQALERVAERRFGEHAAAVVNAWHQFSDAFQEFPYDMAVCYTGPQAMGPANLLYRSPSGYRASMITFPYDDVESWRGPYAENELQEQFELLADKWQIGVAELDRVRAEDLGGRLESEWRVAAACGLHFRSAANQIRYVRSRESDATSALAAVRDEIATARALRALVLEDSRLGFEATAQYIYTELDLLEKMLNCLSILGELPSSSWTDQ